MATRSFARWPTDGHMMWMDGYYGFMFHLMLYYPDREYKRAVHFFRQEIQLTRGLLPALKKLGYKPTQRILTPRQVKLIEHYLGEP